MKIDNTALSAFQACRAMYYIRHVLHLVPIRAKPALTFGGVLHYGIAEWYRTGNLVKAFMAIEKHWPEVIPSDDFRTKAKALEVIRDYVAEYPKEVWRPIEGPSGPLIETAFTLPTGMFCECDECERYMDPEDQISGKCSNCGAALEPIEYGGVIDIGAVWNDMVYVVDHKSTTKLGKDDSNYYFMQFKPDNQMTGYIWGLSQMTNQRVGGAIINAIGLYKSDNSKFRRQITSRSGAELLRFLRDVRDTCNDIRRCHRTGVWRLETGACMRYSACDYHSVHVLPSEVEWQKRLEQDYVVSEWNYENRDD